MFTIKIVGRVRPCEPEPPEQDDLTEWVPRRWAGPVTEWHAGYGEVLHLGEFSIMDGDKSPWAAAREAFDWSSGPHGFSRVHLLDFVESDNRGEVMIAHGTPGDHRTSEVFVYPPDTNVFLLNEQGHTVDRL